MTAKTTTERVPFRLLKTPCCSSLLCWVNPRLPMYCPECGKPCYPEIKSCVMAEDAEATLKVRGVGDAMPFGYRDGKRLSAFERLRRVCARMYYAVCSSDDLSPDDVTLCIPFDYWVELAYDELIPFDAIRPQEQMGKFVMNGITVIRREPDDKSPALDALRKVTGK